MAKLSKEEMARREGMAYALKVAKEKGISGLEAELIMRNALNLPLRISQKDMETFSNNVKMNTIDTVMVLMAVTLHDEFGFGPKRVQRAINRLQFKADCVTENYSTMQEQINIIKEELNINLEIRKNDKDVKI